MAKGLRASSKKSNRSALRSRVFEPVENARLERLHQKLLEAAQQPKPENPKKTEMELDATEGIIINANALHSRHSQKLYPTEIANPASPPDINDTASNEDDFPKGLSYNLTAAIPSSLLHDSNTTSSDRAADAYINEHLFLTLGLGSDVVGFTPDGKLEVAFDTTITSTASPPPTQTSRLVDMDKDPNEELYHLLGLSSDIVGFAPNGQLQLAFDQLPLQH